MDGYTFDSDSFQVVRRAWGDLLTDLENDLAEAMKLSTVAAPGHEPASGFVASTQNSAGQALLSSINQMREFMRGYGRNLDGSELEYQARETSIGQAFDAGMR
jgi:hypothetical protein